MAAGQVTFVRAGIKQLATAFPSPNCGALANNGVRKCHAITFTPGAGGRPCSTTMDLISLTFKRR
jgi:hypothetical protein